MRKMILLVAFGVLMLTQMVATPAFAQVDSVGIIQFNGVNGPGFNPGYYPPPNQLDGYKIERIVTMFYQAILFRDPDASGMQNWYQMIAIRGVLGLPDVARGIAGSQEFAWQVRQQYSSYQIVANIYGSFFRRNMDPQAQGWINMIDRGQAADALAGIVSSYEFQQNLPYY